MKYWNEKIETMPAEEMRKFQLENLKKTTKWVYDKVPFYKKKFDELGERFEAAEAFRIGLAHDIVPIAQLDDRVNETLGPLLVAGPHAQRECKALIRAVAHRPIDDKLVADTVRRIATVRASPEGKEGVASFLEKRSPAWVPADLRKAR